MASSSTTAAVAEEEVEEEVEASPTDEELRKLLKPNCSTDEIVQVVRQFSCDGGVDEHNNETISITIVKELESYDDKNVWITMNGIDYLVKVHNGVESKELIDLIRHDDDASTTTTTTGSTSYYQQSTIHLQNAIMLHLNDSGITTNVPQEPKHGKKLSTPAVIHNLPVVSSRHSPCPLVVRLLGWVYGRPMSSLPIMPIEAIADAGRFLGKLTIALNSLSTEQLTAARRYHQWDGKHTLDLKGFTQYIDSEDRRSIVESVVDAFQTELIDKNVHTAFSTALIHGDFNDANYLANDHFGVSGVIDFGDSVESWRILDLTNAMAYAMLTVYGKQNRSLSAAAAMLRGYHSVCPITIEERQHLTLLIASRLSCSVTLGAYSYQQNPSNEYLLLHSAPAWNALELIWGDNGQRQRRQDVHLMMDRLFHLACSKSAMDTNSPIDCSDLAFPDPSVDDPMATLRGKQQDDLDGEQLDDDHRYGE